MKDEKKKVGRPKKIVSNDVRANKSKKNSVNSSTKNKTNLKSSNIKDKSNNNKRVSKKIEKKDNVKSDNIKTTVTKVKKEEKTNKNIKDKVTKKEKTKETLKNDKQKSSTNQSKEIVKKNKVTKKVVLEDSLNDDNVELSSKPKNNVKETKKRASNVKKSNKKADTVIREVDVVEKKKDSPNKNILLTVVSNIGKSKYFNYVCMFILFIIFIYSSVKLVLNQIDMKRNKLDSKKLIEEVVNYGFEVNEEIPVQNLDQVNIDFDKLIGTNKDTVGWMIFNDGIINNPLVHTSNNYYYLNHNFNKNSSAVGTLFMDYRNSSFNDKNVVLFGHANLDRTMFGSLGDVFKDGFFDKKDADIIYIYDTNNQLIKYKIFSYYIIESEEYYITTHFSSDSSFQGFINTIKNRSYRDLGVDVSVTDNILTLSTCAGTSGTSRRRVIHAKKL